MLSLIVLLSTALVQPKNYYGNIAERLSNMLPRNHVSLQALDDTISQRAFTNLVSYYDFDHSVFLKSDLDTLAKHEFTIDDELKRGNVKFGYEVYNLYVQRLNERMDFVTNLLKVAEWDFSTNEMYTVKRKDAPWPANLEEAQDHWRRRIKNEVLVSRIAREFDLEKNPTNVPPETVEEKLIKKYRQYATVLGEPDEENVLQCYLSSVARAYDPHTDYMSPASKEDFDMEMNLELCGVGAVLNMDDGALKIVEVMPGGPIDVDGRIKEGDKIIGVREGDGEMEDIMWKPIKKSIKKIRGAKGTKVTLDIVPRSDVSGATHKEIELIRDKIKLEDQAATGHVERVTIDGKELKLGYIFLPAFYGTMDKQIFDPDFRSCALDVAKYIADFNSEDVDGLVLDLRGNGGGSLMEAIRLSSLFVPNGPVVQVKDQHMAFPLEIPMGNAVAFRKPMVVMIDRASASASEIVAGHLRDVGRAIVLGDRTTHGKGTVQTVQGMGPDKYGSTKITTARFYRITGDSTQVKGVEADIQLPSLLNSLDIGEDKLPNALPFTRISPAEYTQAWDLDKYIPELQKSHDARVANNERYQKHLKNVEGMLAMSERKEVPLEYEARKVMMRADKDLQELEDDDEESSEEKVISRRKKNQQKKDDVILNEALQILGELTILNHGAEVPEAKGWWE